MEDTEAGQSSPASPASSWHRARLRDQLRAGAGAELCPGYSLSLSLSLSPSQIQSHFEPGPATRPRQAVRAHLVYLHLNHQYRDLHLNAFSQRPSRLQITSTPQAATKELILNSFSSLGEHFLTARTILSWALLAILTTQIRPGESIQMIENENKKSLNDFFDLETFTEKGLTAVKV